MPEKNPLNARRGESQPETIARVLRNGGLAAIARGATALRTGEQVYGRVNTLTFAEKLSDLADTLHHALEVETKRKLGEQSLINVGADMKKINRQKSRFYKAHRKLK